MLSRTGMGEGGVKRRRQLLDRAACGRQVTKTVGKATEGGKIIILSASPLNEP